MVLHGTPEPKLVLLVGKKGTGKDSICKILQEEMKGLKVLHLADALKKIVSDTLGVNLQQIEKFKNDQVGYSLVLSANASEESRESFADQYRITHFRTIRQILQNVGQSVKRHIGTTVWCDLVNSQIDPHSTNIIADVRFPHEYEYFKKWYPNLVCIKCTTDPPHITDWHESEQNVDRVPFDHAFYNPKQGLDKLKQQVQSTGYFLELINAQFEKYHARMIESIKNTTYG